MKEIKDFLKKQGWKYIGKGVFGHEMFGKGNSILCVNKSTFKKEKLPNQLP